MIPMLVDYLDRLEALHLGLQEAITGLAMEALDWVPGEGLNSMAVLVAHTAGAQRYWIGDVAGQDPSGRIREREFQTRGREAEALASLLDQVLEHSRSTLGGLSVADLEARRMAPRDGQSYSVSWCLAHALEHTGLHLGHIQITRQLWQTHQQ